MKKRMLLPLLAMILLAAGSVYAQMSSTPIKANIPFDFTAGNVSLPAGEYRVMSSSDLGTLSIIGSGSALALVNFHATQANAPSSSTKLVFHRYGDRYFLYQVWIENVNRGRELPRTRLEQEIASNARARAVAIVAEK